MSDSKIWLERAVAAILTGRKKSSYELDQICGVPVAVVWFKELQSSVSRGTDFRVGRGGTAPVAESREAVIKRSRHQLGIGAVRQTGFQPLIRGFLRRADFQQEAEAGFLIEVEVPVMATATATAPVTVPTPKSSGNDSPLNRAPLQQSSTISDTLHQPSQAFFTAKGARGARRLFYFQDPKSDDPANGF